MTGILEALTFGPMLAATWHLACATALTEWADWLIDVCEP